MDSHDPQNIFSPIFLHICHTYLFHVAKLFFILDKETQMNTDVLPLTGAHKSCEAQTTKRTSGALSCALACTAMMFLYLPKYGII